jgi:hypothetical protein
MPHEPSGSCPLVQPTADRCCRPHTTVVARRNRQRALREVAHRIQLSHLAMIAQHWRGGGDAA